MGLKKKSVLVSVQKRKSVVTRQLSSLAPGSFTAGGSRVRDTTLQCHYKISAGLMHRVLCIRYSDKGTQASCISTRSYCICWAGYIQVAIQRMLMCRYLMQRKEDYKDGEMCRLMLAQDNTRQRRYGIINKRGNIWKERQPSTPNVYCTEMKEKRRKVKIES